MIYMRGIIRPSAAWEVCESPWKADLGFRDVEHVKKVFVSVCVTNHGFSTSIETRIGSHIV